MPEKSPLIFITFVVHNIHDLQAFSIYIVRHRDLFPKVTACNTLINKGNVFRNFCIKYAINVYLFRLPFDYPCFFSFEFLVTQFYQPYNGSFFPLIISLEFIRLFSFEWNVRQIYY